MGALKRFLEEGLTTMDVSDMDACSRQEIAKRARTTSVVLVSELESNYLRADVLEQFRLADYNEYRAATDPYQSETARM